MSKTALRPTAAEDALIDDLEVPRYILEMLLELRRLAARAGDADLARDLAVVQARAEQRRTSRLH